MKATQKKEGELNTSTKEKLGDGLESNALIQTQTAQGGWVDCDHKSWKELKADGWVFGHATPEGWVVMTRKGYINVFRTNPKSEVSPK